MSATMTSQHAHETQASGEALEEFLRNEARKILQVTIELEVEDYITRHKGERTEDGRCQVVRNGHLPERNIETGIGKIPVKQPRVRDRSGKRKYTSTILPRYMRRLPRIDALIPALYLHGVSTGDFKEALEAILGPDASGLSARNIVRLKRIWEEEYKDWKQRDLSGKRYVYWWVDGIYFNVRLEDERICILVIIGAREDGTKELVAVHDGFRESKASWGELLRALKYQGLTEAPKLVTGDGALGFWAAVEEEFPTTRHQRCWVHKTANILDKMPKKVQPHAKRMIHEMYLAETREDADHAYEEFLQRYEAKYPKACECLRKDYDVLFTFYDFPAEHWHHIRTTNAIESTFATVRHRTRRTKGCGTTSATVAMVYKLGVEAEKHWRRLRKAKRITQILEGEVFINGILQGEDVA